MKFRMNTLYVAVGAALGSAVAAPAFALPASQYALGNVTDVYISGASAQDQGLRAVVARLCVPGTMDRFDNGSNQTAFFYVDHQYWAQGGDSECILDGITTCTGTGDAGYKVPIETTAAK
ncbi:MAG: hypothetical protein ABI794_10730, partial [Betaproteobacteria bacterium]